MNLARYNKLWVALTGALVVVIGRRFGVDSEVYADLTTIITAAAVFFVPNAES